MRRFEALAGTLTLPAFFVVKIVSGLALLKYSALFLPVAAFSVFSQFLLLSALLNMLAVGGAQNGLVREAADAGDDGDRLARARSAAVLIWIAAAVLLGAPLILFSPLVADFLVGRPDLAYGVVAVTLLNLGAGPGQIFASILAGRGQAPWSLACQGIGLVCGTAAALAMLARGEAIAAVVAFSAGPVVAAVLAWARLRSHRIAGVSWRRLGGDVRRLLGFSGAFMAVAATTALTLFALRYFYREQFGLTDLGDWLVAQRVSDTTTQFLGLFLVQFFLPAYTRGAPGKPASAILLKYWGVAVGFMACGLAVFAMFPEFLVRMFLSSRYIGAIGFILGYMAGDVLRVWSSVAMHAAFARGKLTTYVAIEVCVMACMAAITMILILAGNRAAPVIGYVGAYAAAAVITSVLFVARRGRGSGALN